MVTHPPTQESRKHVKQIGKQADLQAAKLKDFYNRVYALLAKSNSSQLLEALAVEPINRVELVGALQTMCAALFTVDEVDELMRFAASAEIDVSKALVARLENAHAAQDLLLQLAEIMGATINKGPVGARSFISWSGVEPVIPSLF